VVFIINQISCQMTYRKYTKKWIKGYLIMILDDTIAKRIYPDSLILYRLSTIILKRNSIRLRV